MAALLRRTELESRYQRERAYGVYMGWRTLVIERAEPTTFDADDQRLAAMLHL